VPLAPTPNFPEFTSGHTVVSGAMATMLGLLFGDDPGVQFTVTSPTNPGFTRTWSTFSAGIDEVVNARVWTGFQISAAPTWQGPDWARKWAASCSSRRWAPRSRINRSDPASGKWPHRSVAKQSYQMETFVDRIRVTFERDVKVEGTDGFDESA
jgi:hypothetical protein